MILVKLLEFKDEEKNSYGHQVKKNQKSYKNKIIRLASHFLEKHILSKTSMKQNFKKLRKGCTTKNFIKPSRLSNIGALNEQEIRAFCIQ